MKEVPVPGLKGLLRGLLHTITTTPSIHSLSRLPEMLGGCFLWNTMVTSNGAQEFMRQSNGRRTLPFFLPFFWYLSSLVTCDNPFSPDTDLGPGLGPVNLRDLSPVQVQSMSNKVSWTCHGRGPAS